jgi:multidrug efflux pump subunit AcrA (membrane-fusion protein)
MFNPFRKAKNGVVNFYTKRSTLAFFSTIIVLFALIAAAHYFRTPEPEAVKPEREAKKTALYSAASPIYLQAMSETKKEGVTQIVALSSGIVSQLLVKPGMAVQDGTTLMTLTNNYDSGAEGLEKEIAKNNLLLAQEIYELDQDIQRNEREIAENQDDADVTRREREVNLKSLEKARETRKVTLANAELNYKLALIDDAVLKPRSMSSGFVQSIEVKKGEYVGPGDVLATISNPFGNTTLEAFVVSEIAPFIDITKEARITLADGTVTKVVPTYFSASEDQDGMFMIQFVLSDEVAKGISSGSTPKVELPLRFTHEATILVPLDTVYKNTDSSVVLVNVNGQAESREVTLGRVRGNYIEVLSGLNKEDQIILNRFVLAGDKIEVIEE